VVSASEAEGCRHRLNTDPLITGRIRVAGGQYSGGVDKGGISMLHRKTSLRGLIFNGLVRP